MSMTGFLLGAAVLALATVMVALARLLKSRLPLDWVMAGQLLGTAGIAALLLLGTATAAPGVIDLALVLALLTAFATLAFTASLRRRAEQRARRLAPDVADHHRDGSLEQ